MVSFRSRCRNLRRRNKNEKVSFGGEDQKTRDASNEPLENLELSSVLCMNVPPLVLVITWRDDVVAAFEIARKVEKIGMVAELLQDVNGLERLGSCSSKELLDLG